MSAPLIDDLLLQLPATVRDALWCIDRNAQGVCFATDGAGRFLGTITDGDIRRGLLSGVPLDSDAASVTHVDAVTLPVDASNDDIQRRLSFRITHIPLLDPSGVPVDYASMWRLRQIPVLEPVLGARELEYVTECIETNWISSQGRFVQRFEGEFAQLTDQPWALAVTSGTTALHLALEALGVGEGDEVIVPAFTFAATANAVIHARARPVLVDVEPGTWTMSARAVESALSSRTRAIIPVHMYGNPCDMGPILELAVRHDLLVVEDCAEALGATYRGRPAGSMGDAATFSFYGNKVITTGEGGMVVFRDGGVARRAKRLRDHGMSPERRYWHEEVGFNYRMTNLQAAVGTAQLERLPGFLSKHRRTAERYRELLGDVDSLAHQVEQPGCTSSWWLYTVLVDPASGLARDEIIDKLARAGIETRPAFPPLHVMPPYRDFAVTDRLPVAEALGSTGVSLPSSATLTENQAELVADRLRSVLGVREALGVEAL